MITTQRFTFGPLPSRRLGRSLGIDVIPKKVCCYDCIYCEVGPTTRCTIARKEYCHSADVLAELRSVLESEREIDWITFSGSGEPTLNAKLGEMIHAVKQMSDIPVAVITNGALLFLDSIRQDLLEADAVLPSLNAVTPAIFEAISRPHTSLTVETVISGLRFFRREYSGQIWLEILFVQGINDGEDEVARMKGVLDELQPDKIHLNTVVRPPVESSACPVSLERMEQIRKVLGDRCEIIGDFKDIRKHREELPDPAAILALLRRRSMTVEELAVSIRSSTVRTKQLLEELRTEGKITAGKFRGIVHYGFSPRE